MCQYGEDEIKALDTYMHAGRWLVDFLTAVELDFSLLDDSPLGRLHRPV